MGSSSQQLRMGKALREHRLRLGMSLSTVAAKAKLSTGFLSLLENGKTDATVGRLSRLLDVYGVRMGDLIGPSGEVSITDQTTNPTPTHGSTEFDSLSEGVVYKFFEAEGSFTPVYVSIAPNQGWLEPSVHNGDEYDYILEGSVEVLIGESLVEVHAGECAHIPSGTPHKFRNSGAVPTRLFAIVADRT